MLPSDLPCVGWGRFSLVFPLWESFVWTWQSLFFQPCKWKSKYTWAQWTGKHQSIDWLWSKVKAPRGVGRQLGTYTKKTKTAGEVKRRWRWWRVQGSSVLSEAPSNESFQSHLYCQRKVGDTLWFDLSGYFKKTWLAMGRRLDRDIDASEAHTVHRGLGAIRCECWASTQQGPHSQQPSGVFPTHFQALPPTLYFSFAAYLLPAWHFCLDDENVGQTGHFQHCITSHSFPKSLPLLHFQGPKIGGSLGKYLREILAFILASCRSPLKDIYFLLSSLDSQSKYDISY